MASTQALGLKQAAAPVDLAWIAINSIASVGAALRALGQWSLDGSPRRFDAEDWWFRLDFSALPAVEGERVVLGLDGMATIAQAWLNDNELLSSTNMFVAHECDVGQILCSSGNTLVMRFSALDTELAVRRKRPRWRAPMIEHQQLRWFRTTVLGRTPGWSPPVAVVGPWKDVWMERRQQVELSAVVFSPRVCGADGALSCTLDLTTLGNHAVDWVELQLAYGDAVITQRLQACDGRFSGKLVVPDVSLWWPHTHGEPALYAVIANIQLVGEAQPIQLGLRSVGFRTLHWDTADGNFALTVNGVSVFCRGACWAPLDVVTLRSTAEETTAAVTQAAAAGMNMLRVTGTTVYEDEHFFDACDKQGVLVWQDFMFANMDFPADDPAFVQSVTTEVRQQLARIQARACLALLCGNSEAAQQAAMWGAARELWSNAQLDDALSNLCAELAPGTLYWPSSAYGGAFPHQGNAGTTSYYGVGAYLRDFGDARRSGVKFATECLAFANIPPDVTLERMPGGMAVRAHHAGWKERSPRDLGAGWDFDDVRDHYLAAIFGVDPLKLRYSDHRRYLTLGRMATAEAMAAAFSEWRRPGASCKGALVLFMRDLWAGAGWGVLDDLGTPKACFHHLSRVLQPVTVLLADEGGSGLFVHLLNESPVDRQLQLEVCVWRGGDVLVAAASKDCPLAAHATQSLSCVELFDHFIDLTHAYRFGPPVCDAVVATLYDEDGHQLAQTFYFPQGLSELQERDAALNAEAVALDSQTVQVTLTAKRLAVGVHFDAMGYAADNEFFHLAPNSKKQIILRSNRPRTLSGVVCSINAMADVPLKCIQC